MGFSSSVTAPEAIEYLRLRRVKELKKLQRHLAEDEVREANLPTSTAPLPAYTDDQQQARLAALGRRPDPRNEPQSSD
jgi:hypothetical protein